MKNPLEIIRLFLGFPVSHPIIIELKDGSRYAVRSAMDAWVLKETCLDKDYERFGDPIEGDWNVIDVGAGLGDFAISVGLSHPLVKIYAFEPFSESYSLMLENINLNQVENVIAYPYAVSAEAGIRNLLTVSGVAVQHSTAKTEETVDGNEYERVDCVGLDWLFVEHRMDRCDLLKVDCEGGEYEIFFQMDELILKRIARISLEYHDQVTPYNHQDLERYLESHGFKVKTHPNPVHSLLGFMYAWNLELVK
jgi:FkbM family methyltransferase